MPKESPKKTTREAWASTEMEGLWQDLKFAARVFRKIPNFTICIVLSLAIGIGATCSIFSVVYGVLIDPYIYKDARRIMVPTFSEPDSDGRRPDLPYTSADFMDLEASSKAFESMILTSSHEEVIEGTAPRNVNVLGASANYFDFFGTPALLGRTFSRGDVPKPQDPPLLAVIGYQLWTKQFNGSPDVIGRDLKLRDGIYKIMGVMPPRFTWFDTDVFVPEPMRPRTHDYASVYLRLREGIAVAAADAELQALTERFALRNQKQYPYPPFHMHASTLQDWLLGKLSGKLLILMTAVSFLLLIACANVSVLLLSRSEARKEEIAMRLALGAGTSRIFRQLLTEALLLASVGCAFGVLLAWQGVPAILAVMPETSLPHESVIGLNLPVLLFAVLIAMLTGVLAGLAPAFHLAKTAIHETVQSGIRTTFSRTRGINVRAVLVIAEIALTAMLLVGSGVAIRNLIAVYHADLGYDPKDVAAVSVILQRTGKKSWEERKAFYDRMGQALREIPGVQSVAQTLGAVPPSIMIGSPVEVPGVFEKSPAKAAVGLVSSDYFDTLRTPIVQGRVFNASEVQQGVQVAVVNEVLARRLIQKGLAPVGAEIRIPGIAKYDQDFASPPDHEPSFQVVGVVTTIENQALLASTPAIYIPYTYLLGGDLTFLIRTHGSPQRLQNIIQTRLRTFVDSDEPLAEFDTLEHILVVNSLSDPQSSATLFSIFAVLAVALASLGLYSVVSFSLAQRTKEFAIRIAVGAQTRQVAAMILSSTFGLTAIGVALGMAGSFIFGNVLAYYEQGWQPRDPVILLSIPTFLLAVNLMATLVPIWRAASISPNDVLRNQ
jgi:putative ABC transport system permease protein